MSAPLLRSLFFLALASSLAACSLVEECGPFEDKFRTTDFVTRTYQVQPADSLDPRPRFLPVERDTLSFGQFGISMIPVQDYYFSQSRGRWSPTLISAAHACSPPVPSSDEIVHSIEVYSDTDYSRDYPAGTDLADLFDLFAFDLARSVYYERVDLRDYLARAPNTVDEIVLVPSVAPDTTATFTFTVRYFQEGEGIEYYAFTTEAITLRPR
jgi:hypothetical protein